MSPNTPKTFSTTSAQKPSTNNQLQTFTAKGNKQHHEHRNHHNHYCHICAEGSPVGGAWAVTDCGHVYCGRCAVRIRVLYGVGDCPLCKQPLKQILLTKEHPQTDGDSNKIVTKLISNNDGIEGIVFSSESLLRLVREWLSFRCPGGGCGAVFASKAALRRHISQDHRVLKDTTGNSTKAYVSSEGGGGFCVCDLCWEHRKCFTDEIECFKEMALMRRHSAATHPPCPACHRAFYADDDLMEHCRKQHELCHLCDRERRQALSSNINQSNEQKRASSEAINNYSSADSLKPFLDARRLAERSRHGQLASPRTAPYFADYAALAEHFARAHHPCLHPLCRDELKFVVFAGELELKAHHLQVHSAGDERMQRSEAARLRRLDVVFGQQGSNRPATPPITSRAATVETSNLTNNSSVPTLSKQVQAMQLGNRLDALKEHLRAHRNQFTGVQQKRIMDLVTSVINGNNNGMSAEEFVKKLELIVPKLFELKSNISSSNSSNRIGPWKPITASNVSNRDQVNEEQDGLMPLILESLMAHPVSTFREAVAVAYRDALQQHQSFPSLPDFNGKDPIKLSSSSLSSKPSVAFPDLDAGKKKDVKAVVKDDNKTGGFKILRITKPPSIVKNRSLDPAVNPTALTGGIGSATIANKPPHSKKNNAKDGFVKQGNSQDPSWISSSKSVDMEENAFGGETLTLGSSSKHQTDENGNDYETTKKSSKKKAPTIYHLTSHRRGAL